MLETLGLGQQAENVYRAMLENPTWGIVELCEELELSEVQLRARLDELANVALVRASRESPDRVSAVSLDIGLATLLRQQEADLLRRQRELVLNKVKIEETIAAYADSQPHKYALNSQRLVGVDAIQAKLDLLATELTSECLSVMPGGAQSEASLQASRPLDQAAIMRGVDVQTLYQDSARNDSATYSYAQWLVSLGGQVRTAPTLPPRMIIFDRTTALLPIDPTNSRAGALYTSEPAIVASLTAVYEHAWAIAVPLGSRTTEDLVTGLSALDRRLLTLLATGLTDDAAGKRLGVSARTVRRQMSALMERLNATSRFEAGIKAAQRGWL